MLPPPNNPRWRELLGGREFALKCFGLKIMLSRLKLDYKTNPSSLNACIQEICTFCSRNPQVVRDDLQTIFG
jgi:hypothetical protein